MLSSLTEEVIKLCLPAPNAEASQGMWPLCGQNKQMTTIWSQLCGHDRKPFQSQVLLSLESKSS